MKITFYKGLLLLFLLSACSSDQEQVQKGPKSPFQTTQPSVLYFKNMRSVNYKQRRQEPKMDVYTFRQFTDTDSRPILYPLIVNNWLQDEAYLLIERNEFGAFADSLIVQWESPTDSSGTFYLANTFKQQQYEFGLALYQRLKEDCSLKIKSSDGTYVPLFDQKEDRFHYATVVRDFLRLTEAL
ncbi:MAG: hypothetical protein AAFP19_03690 [Bacteroidota bacterium]